MTAVADWVPRRMGELVTLTSGQSPSRFRFGSTGTPYYKVDQLGRSKKFLRRSSTQYFSMSLPSVPAGSVLIAKRGGAIALNRVRLTTEPSFMDTNVMALTPSTEINSEFLYYWLSHRGLWDIADVTSVPQINNKHINPLQIALPSPAEQREIAMALRGSDDLIATLERLITKKQAIKHGMMQQLLTGKTRLPGFTAPWGEHASFEDLCTRSTGFWGAAGASSDTPHEVQVITAGDITPEGRLKGAATRYFSNAQVAKARCMTDDLVVTSSGNGLGKTAYIDEPGNLAASNFVRILRPRKGVSGSFLAQVMRTPDARAVLDSNTATSAYPNLLPAFFTQRWIPRPPSGEQLAIAAVLQDADSEITALQVQVSKARVIKAGMMQELLTGRTRLPVAEDAA